MTENKLSYTIKRSRRKTLAIHITKDAAVEIRAPLRISEQAIEKFAKSKEKWIHKHQESYRRQISESSVFSINYGDTVFVCGKRCPIKASDGGMAHFDGEIVHIPKGMSENEIKRTVIDIYKMIAKSVIDEKTARFAVLMDVTPAAVRINRAKTRWGSCSSKSNLNFSWRLIMADDEVIDYVVVHELAHIKEHNHSDRFWAVVAFFLPDYKKRQAELKKLQKRLAVENWD